MLIAAAVGFILQSTGSYLIVFVIAGSAYWLALALFAFLVPRIDTVELT
jgi:ACS family hexuronate transporter-like MFS transporter